MKEFKDCGRIQSAALKDKLFEVKDLKCLATTYNWTDICTGRQRKIEHIASFMYLLGIAKLNIYDYFHQYNLNQSRTTICHKFCLLS
jgi:hypothetical protein